MTSTLTTAMLELLRGRASCFVSTLMPDGSPQLTETWVDTDGEHIIINTVDTHQKTRNVRRDPRVAVAIADPEQPARYFSIRGRVLNITTDGAADHIDALSQRYLGRPYPGFSANPGDRIMLIISVDRVVHPLR